MNFKHYCHEINVNPNPKNKDETRVLWPQSKRKPEIKAGETRVFSLRT